jgi:hypothetical protein
MRLFDVSAGQSVRITSKLIRWVEHASEQLIGEDVTWTGIATDRYVFYKGCVRRMLVNHTIPFDEYAIWQRDCECEVVARGRRNEDY